MQTFIKVVELGGVAAAARKRGLARPTLRVNSRNVLSTTVLAGHDVIGQPEFLLKDDPQAGRLIPLLTDYVQRPLTMALVYPHRRSLAPTVRTLVEYRDSRFGQRRQTLESRS